MKRLTNIIISAALPVLLTAAFSCQRDDAMVDAEPVERTDNLPIRFAATIDNAAFAYDMGGMPVTRVVENAKTEFYPADIENNIPADIIHVESKFT